jgi:uncharacterized iron-regulated membrane protein
MINWQGWVRRPQNVWLRRAMFQVHLWSGIALGLYVLAISVSGSAIVFRNEIYREADQGPKIVEVRGEKLSDQAMKAAALKVYPSDTVSYLWPAKEANHATEIWLDHKGSRNQRLFDPYTGADLGPSVPYPIQIASWFEKLHTDLLAGETGRAVNGGAAVLFTLLCITGAIVWWPGIDKWKRSLWLNPKSGWKRLNWDLHSSIGFWSFGLVFMWAVTGIFVVWPLPFEKVINYYSPLIQYSIPEDVPDDPPKAMLAMPDVAAQVTILPPPDAQGKGGFGFGKGKGKGRPPIRRSPGDNVIRWIYYLHFGNFAGNKTKALWVVLGLLPSLLFVTGTIMWWNRVLSPSARRAKKAAAANAVTVS